MNLCVCEVRSVGTGCECYYVVRNTIGHKFRRICRKIKVSVEKKTLKLL